MIRSDINLRNLFSLYHLIASKCEKIKKYDRGIYKIIMAESSVWPNAIFNIDLNSQPQIFLENINKDLKRFSVKPILISQHSDEEIDFLRRNDFLLIDRWTGMSLNLSDQTSSFFSNEFGIACREVNENDLDIWLKILTEGLFANRVLSLDIFSTLMASGSSRFILLEKDSVALGCSMIFYDDDNTAGIYMVCIKKEERGKGYAKHLLGYTLDVIRSLNKSKVVLQSTRMGVPLYKSFNFNVENIYNLFIKK